MKIYDISMNIYNEMTMYKNNDENRPVRKVLHDFSNNSSFDSNILIQMHTGTHMDAPLHMVEGGDTIENMDLTKVITSCKVIDLTYIEDRITKEDLVDKDIKKDDFIIFKTRNSFKEEFDFGFVFLEKSGAEYLKDIGIKGAGTDALGIERSQEDHMTHKALLGEGIVILEGLRLKEVEEGEYFLIAAPLKINGSEASPVRALLIKGLY